MFKTVEFTIWPEKLNFPEKIKRIKTTLASEFKLIQAPYGYRKWDNSFHLTVDNLERYTCDSHEEFINALSKHQEFQGFSWHLCFKSKGYFKEERFGVGIDYNKRTIEVQAHSSRLSFIDRAIQVVKDELTLKKAELIDVDGYRRKMLDPKIFISRHFDDTATDLFYRIDSFLNLLGFQVVQGEEYTSATIPEKVKHRIEEQTMMIVMVTGTRDHDWLIGEIGYALGKDKHIILLIQNGITFNTTILGKDFEYIKFEPSSLDKVFCSLLREFRSIGIKGLFY